MSRTGRFLEHSRIFHFANGGQPEWFIGSADLRTRNLRRRIELLVPVQERVHQATLDRLLQLYVDDPAGWELDGSGTYTRRAGSARARRTGCSLSTGRAVLLTSWRYTLWGLRAALTSPVRPASFFRLSGNDRACSSGG
jgi:polyphosphate kinase